MKELAKKMIPKSKWEVFWLSLIVLTLISGVVLSYFSSSKFGILATVTMPIAYIYYAYKREYLKDKRGKGGFRNGIRNYLLIPIANLAVQTVFLIPLVLLYPNPQHLPSTGGYEKESTLSKVIEIVSSATAGYEEIWRIATISLLMLFIFKLTKQKNTYTLWTAGILSSFAFGWLHSFGYANDAFDLPITIVIGFSGLYYFVLFLLTRRIGVVILCHSLWDLSTTADLQGWGVPFGITIAALCSAGIAFFLFSDPKFLKQLKFKSGTIKRTKQRG